MTTTEERERLEQPMASRQGHSSAASMVYDCECALHAARQSRVDDWIRAAADRLHESLLALGEAGQGEHRSASGAGDQGAVP